MNEEDNDVGVDSWKARKEQSRRSGAYQKLKERRDKSPISIRSLADTLALEGDLVIVTEEDGVGQDSWARRAEQARRSGAHLRLKGRQGRSHDLSEWRRIIKGDTE